MQRLDASDVGRIARFLFEAESVEGDEPFPPDFLAALRRLVPCDLVEYCELDRVRQTGLRNTAFPSGSEEPEAGVSYWEIRHEHPVCSHHELTGDWRAYRLSDFVTAAELRRRRIHAEWFLPSGVAHELCVGLDAPLSHTKVFVLDRLGGSDFTERDCAVLNYVRPYLARRRRAADVQRRERQNRSTWNPGLTPREREILDLVAEGKTNAEIGEELWISPGTVRRHLQNAFVTLQVHTRTAAVAASRTPGPVHD